MSTFITASTTVTIAAVITITAITTAAIISSLLLSQLLLGGRDFQRFFRDVLSFFYSTFAILLFGYSSIV